MRVDYNSGNPADQWRCNLYALRARPGQVAIVIIQGIFWGFLIASTLHLGWIGGLIGMAVGVLIMTGVVLLTTALLVSMRTQSGVRLCATVLAPEGVVDMAPEKTAVIPWHSIKEVRLHDGDLFVWAGMTMGMFIPRTAFADARHGQAFRDAIEAGRRGDFSWLAPYQPQPYAPMQPGNWPPPPSAGYPPPPPNAPIDQGKWPPA